MAQQNATADGGTDRKPTRITDDLSLADVHEDDRIDPALVPRSPEIDVGDPVTAHLPRQANPDDDRTYSVRLVARGEDRWGDVQTALVYDPEADLFARLGSHTASGAMNQKERDWKVRDVGRDVVVTDTSDVEIPDLPDDETPESFVAEWVDIAFTNARHGDDIPELEKFDGKRFRLRDWDDRTAWVTYQLED